MVLLETNTKLGTSISSPAKDFVVFRNDEYVVTTTSDLRNFVRQRDLLEEHIVVMSLYLLIVIFYRQLTVTSITDVEDFALIGQHQCAKCHTSYLFDLGRERNLRLVVRNCSTAVIRWELQHVWAQSDVVETFKIISKAALDSNWDVVDALAPQNAEARVAPRVDSLVRCDGHGVVIAGNDLKERDSRWFDRHLSLAGIVTVRNIEW